ncbi:hypothetical protein [Paenibacillus xylanexedens]|uniref:hypothetical protein n=1 Tax=Paenibacillus xylanexedens TaxID=528191 RepID=UPI0011A47CD6|nr:hypothetical protein [Paenibacillus xylanexedens]
MLSSEMLWWNQVAGPSRYLQDALEAILEGGTTFINETAYMEHFFMQINDKLLHKNSSLQIDIYDASEFIIYENIEDTLIHKYVAEYNHHPMDGSLIKAIAEKNLLSGRILIIRNIEEDERWINLGIEFSKYCSFNSGAILFTYNDKKPLLKSHRQVSVFDLVDYITIYDMQLFASYCIADQSSLSFMMKNYITQIISRVSGNDPEICKELALMQIGENALGILNHFAENNSKIRKMLKSVKNIEDILWEAQIQTVFPIIEQERKRIIESYYDELVNLLPVTDEFGKKIYFPQDMELRHIRYYYLKATGGLSKEDDEIFQLIYSSRNDLAHLKILEGQVLQRIFALKSFTTMKG